MKLFLLLLFSTTLVNAASPNEHAVLKALPVLSSKCASCHGEDPTDIAGDLNLLTREGFLQGGENIKNLLIPGKPEESFLMKVIRWEDPDYEMPPKENDRLNPQQIQEIETWIRNGAPWPDEVARQKILLAEKTKQVTEEGILIKTSGGLADNWTYRRYRPERVWAFLPLTKPNLPAAGPSPIDHLIRAKQNEALASPSPRADLTTLIRRVSFDLTGLPPSPSEVREFVDAASSDFDSAYSALIDRLLKSPHYGERWAQHWLDIARYADTGGMSNDYERSNAWRYRDYVIRSFNNNKPYNEFILEQIAGDELAEKSLRERVGDPKKYKELRKKGHFSPSEAEQMIASTFLRLGPWDPAMVKAPEARQQFIDDVVNSVGQTFLGTTMRCFKCHDHKFDPLPTRDYYRMYAIFEGTQLAERHVSWQEFENKERFDEESAQVEVLYQFANREATRLRKKVEDQAREWYQENDRPYKSLSDRKKDPVDQKPPRHVGLSETEKGQLKVREQDEWIWKRRRERFLPMVQSVYNGPPPRFLNARSLRVPNKVDSKWQPNTHILAGGSLQAAGEKVVPGVLSALGLPVPGLKGSEITAPLEGRRLSLARWITHPDNPLTARTIVNRIWQYHFGKPIAGNPNNLGSTGSLPTHPELLDWLAADFVENGWDLKRLHCQILFSETYLQSGRHPDHDELIQQDPQNNLFARFPHRRLSAEELRDSMLQITGELNPTLGGLPVRPEMNMEVALQPRMIQFSIAPTYLPNRRPEQRNRRSIYAYRVRGLADPFLETFNQPNPNDSCEIRDSASISPQAFTLMNSNFITDRSIALATRLEEEEDTLISQINLAFELVFHRQPSKKEIAKTSAYVEKMKKYHDGVTPEPRHYPVEITRSLVEEFSGKPFEYKEILPVFRNYQRDLQASDVSPATRALADLCLVLFNSHEFLYLY